MNGIVIVDPPQAGDRNMQIDDALLATATPDAPIVVRVYQWSQPTLSLGYFQKLEDRETFPSLREVPWVRRKTGGGAILHDHELTYSIVIPDRGDKKLKGHSEVLYREIHRSFIEMIQSLGVQAELSEDCTCKTDGSEHGSRSAESFLCFLRRSPVDIVSGVFKILGSAQRRTSTGLLQHGSLLLRRSSFTPDLLGLLDLQRVAAVSADFDQTLKRLIPMFVSSLTRGVDAVFHCSWKEKSIKNLPHVLRSVDEILRNG